jgi:hypothetical protein
MLGNVRGVCLSLHKSPNKTSARGGRLVELKKGQSSERTNKRARIENVVDSFGSWMLTVSTGHAPV